jgi:hypothetical protein
MSEQMVRVYDFDSRTLTTIPAAELSSSMIRAKVQGIEGEVWVDGSQVKLKDKYQHPPFSEETRELLKQIQETFKDMCPKTVEEWEDGFRKDTHPDREIAIWLHMGKAYAHFTAGRVVDPDQKQDILNVILACVTNGKDYVLQTTNPRTLSRKRVKEIIDFVCTKNEGPAALRPSSTVEHSQSVSATDTIPVGFLFDEGLGPNLGIQDFHLRRELQAAEVIYGFDVMSHDEFLIYGLELLEEISKTGRTLLLRVLWIPIDQETEEFEKLIELVINIKGSHDYQGGEV